jgi:hypothetical protein
MRIEELGRRMRFADPPPSLKARIFARPERGGGYLFFTIAFAVALAGFAIADHALSRPAGPAREDRTAADIVPTFPVMRSSALGAPNGVVHQSRQANLATAR